MSKSDKKAPVSRGESLRTLRKVLAVIGASEFQDPLIRRARELGCTVHAFAWACGDVGERTADVFHPVYATAEADLLSLYRADGTLFLSAVHTLLYYE